MYTGTITGGLLEISPASKQEQHIAQMAYFFHPKSTDIFLISPQKPFVVVLAEVLLMSTQYSSDVLLMSTHNICFCREIRKLDMCPKDTDAPT